MAATVAADEADPSVVPTSGRRRRLAGPLVAALAYALLACLVYLPYGPLDANHLVGCACSDPVQGTWFLAWTPYALARGHNPLFTGYLNAPYGANLAVNTSSPLLGVLGWPVTATLGPIATFNLLLRLGLAASAFAMFLLLRRYTRWWPGAFLGGLLFGFSPYMMGHARYHMFLVFVPLVPLLVALVDDWLIRLRRAPWTSGLLIGLVAALQFLISPEILVLTVLFTGVGLLTLAYRHRAEAAARVRPLLRGLIFAATSFVVVAGYPVWMLLAGPQRPIGPVHTLTDNLNNYRADLLALVVPTHGELLAPPLIERGTFNHHHIVENGFYLGIPLLVLLGYLAWRSRRLPVVRMSVVIAAVAFVFGLGTRLAVAGVPTGVPMPFEIITRLPVLQNIAAARLSFVIQFAAALLLAVGLDRVRAARRLVAAREGAGPARWHQRDLAVVAIAVIALLPVVPRVPLTQFGVDVPDFFTTSRVDVIPRGALVLTYPYDVAPDNVAMQWQWSSHFRFRMFGGEVFVPDVQNQGRSTTHALWPLPSPLKGPFIRHRSWRQVRALSARDVRALQRFVARRHVDAIVVNIHDPQAVDVSLYVTAAFGQATTVDNSVMVWVRPEAVPVRR